MQSYRFARFSLLVLFGCLTSTAFAQENVLFNFSNEEGGPSAGLVFDSQGNLLGTSGGAVYQLVPKLNGESVYSELYQFSGGGGDGAGPSKLIPIRDSKGNLFWTAPFGGTKNCGFVYELSPSGNASWTGKAIYQFQRDSSMDGCSSQAPLTIDGKGNLFGTTGYGGSNGGGTVFELSPEGSGEWIESVLWSFGARVSGPTTSDGWVPQAGLVLDSQGNIFGTTFDGGAPGDDGGAGIVFELTPQGDGTWKETILHTFGLTKTDGAFPEAGLIFDREGNLYGTTSEGGTEGCGAVFELSPEGNGSWNEKTLHSFCANASDGITSEGGLVLDSLGNLYGTTTSGGSGSFKQGTVYQLVPESGGQWLERIIANFNLPLGGFSPQSTLMTDASDNLYGTTPEGGIVDGNLGNGTVFEVLEPNVTAIPRFTPAPGIFDGAQSVRIADATSSTTIYYTTDGSEPTDKSTKYTDSIQVTKSETIRAIAIAVGDKPSSVVPAEYAIESPTSTPQFSPKGGIYKSIQHVRLTSTTPHAAIYYTIDGTKPITSSKKYSVPIAIKASLTLKAIAVAEGHLPSAAAAASYVIHLPPASKPTLSPNGGTYTKAQSVRLTDKTPGAVFYYTFEKNTPIRDWTKYTPNGIEIRQSETVYVIATASGHAQSPVASATFILNLPSAAKPIF